MFAINSGVLARNVVLIISSKVKLILAAMRAGAIFAMARHGNELVTGAVMRNAKNPRLFIGLGTSMYCHPIIPASAIFL